MVKDIINALNLFCNPVSKIYSDAANLSPAERKDISIKTLAGGCVTEIADSNKVSLKFIYKQKEIANKGLDQAFNPVPKDDEVLFYLPVTKRWIRQFVLAKNTDLPQFVQRSN